MINFISPLLIALSSLIAVIILMYLTVFNDYHTWSWGFVAGSWIIWVAIQDNDSFVLTFLSPAFLLGFVAIKILAGKYRRA